MKLRKFLMYGFQVGCIYSGELMNVVNSCEICILRYFGLSVVPKKCVDRIGVSHRSLPFRRPGLPVTLAKKNIIHSTTAVVDR